MHKIATKSHNLLFYRSIRLSVVFNMLIILMLAIVFDIIILPNILPNSIPLILFLIWCISTLFIEGNLITTINRSESVWWMVILLWETVLVLFGFSSIGINNILFKLPIYSIPIIMSFVIRNYYYREKVILFAMLFLVIMFNIVKNDIIGFSNPLMYETLRRSDGFAAGSTTFTAVTLFFFPICFLLLINKKTSKFIKLSSLFSIGAASYYFFVFNSRAIAFFLFLIILIGFIVSPKRSFKNMNQLYLILPVIFLISFFYLFFNPFMDILRDVFAGNANLLMRFDNITDFSQTQNIQDTGSLGARIQLSIISLNTWFGGFSNFFFGIGEHPVYDTSIQGLTNAGEGQHSQFFDHLARYGLLGGIILYKAIKNTLYFILKRALSPKMYNLTYIVLIVFILYSFLNNSFIGNILLVVFLVFPLIIDIFENKESKSYE